LQEKKRPLDRGEATIDKVWSKMSVRTASEAYSVPAGSLHNRLVRHNKAKNVIVAPDVGTVTMTFSDEQEDDLVAYIKDLDSRLMFVLVLGR
jgi:hypothetical protein